MSAPLRMRVDAVADAVVGLVDTRRERQPALQRHAVARHVRQPVQRIVRERLVDLHRLVGRGALEHETVGIVGIADVEPVRGGVRGTDRPQAAHQRIVFAVVRDDAAADAGVEASHRVDQRKIGVARRDLLPDRAGLTWRRVAHRRHVAVAVIRIRRAQARRPGRALADIRCSPAAPSVRRSRDPG